MICPFCSHPDIKVLETRETSETETRRRRECLKCEKRFTTYERVELKPLQVIKKDGHQELFDREKIIRGIVRSCQKRPITVSDIEHLVDNIEHHIRSSGADEVKSTKIGNLVMTRLKKLDKVAYIRFASIYRDFDDLQSFEEEVSKLAQKVITDNIKK
ncbi:MAG: transcriptional repressor NrdR [Nanoarchaeota archaeon]|nr:transcriptional repressor NrdR [Nanoarchaeota archaeon]